MQTYMPYQSIQILKKEDNDRIIWLKRDIYNYTDVVKAMEGMDIAVFI